MSFASYLPKITFLISFISCISHGQTDSTFVVNKSEELVPLQKGLYILRDTFDIYSPSRALASEKFILHRNGAPNLGISRSTFWIKFQVRNLSANNHLLLKILHPNIEYISFYKMQNNKIVLVEETGIAYPYNHRRHDNQYFLFDIKLNKDEKGTFLLRLKTTGQLQVPLWTGSYNSVMKSLKKDDWFMCLYVGAVLAMFFYNLFVFLSVRSQSYFIIFTIG